MPECLVKIPQVYETPAETVAGGHTIKFYGTVVAASFGLTATALTFGLIFAQMTHYSKPNEQKHIMRILLMVPVYALFSSLSALSYPSALYVVALQEFYEAVALASLFNLFCNYFSPFFDMQFDYLKSGGRTTSVPGEGGPSISERPNKSKKWFMIITIAAYQYLPVKALVTILTFITQAAGVYCEDSTSAGFAHIWLFVSSSVSLVICIIGILCLYRAKALHAPLVAHKAAFQLICIKFLVILDSLQPEIIKILTSKKVIPISRTLTYGDISVGIPGVLLTVESFIVAIMFFFVYNPNEYRNLTTTLEDGTARRKLPVNRGFRALSALWEMLFMWDLVKGTAFAFGLVPLLFRRDKDGSPQVDQEQRQMVRPSRSSQNSDNNHDEHVPTAKPTQRDDSPYGNSSDHSQDTDVELETVSKPYRIRTQ